MINPLTMLQKKLRGRSQLDLAKEIGCSETYVSLVLSGERDPGPRILEYLGLEKVTGPVSYRKKNGYHP
jgi:transcriptional regulator with XRE-family HTH domain